ncbi:MAG: thioredoxin domain-containing protein [Bdellovibrionaceae bacterium]|nr:thioredoxin domain-containing protein [Pseudobdellovibrionaceae bacterium]
MSAPLVIEEFADFECHYCSAGAKLMKRALRDYPGQIRLVLRNSPLPGHANAQIAAQAFSAVCLQGAELADAFQSELFENQENLRTQGQRYLDEAAQKVGANVARMKADMVGPAVVKSLRDDLKAAELHSFSGTPSFLIGSEKVTGARPYSEIKKIIDRQLRR